MNSILKLVLTLILLPPCIRSQQNYSGDAVFDCSYATMHSDSLAYKCNGHNSSCKAFLIFPAMSPYDTTETIANLTSSDPTEISQLNNNTKFLEGQEVIIPVKCSCSGQDYGANTTYQILPDDTYYLIANRTFRGLSTCDALERANKYPETYLMPGQRLLVPLRCACPTVKQADSGTKFLLTYTLGFGDTLYALSERFNISLMSIKEANSFTDDFVTLEPFTTILIPLKREPSHSYAKHISPPLPLPLPRPVLITRSKRVLLIVGIAAGAFLLLVLLLLALLFLSHRKRTQSESRNAKVTSPEELILEIAKLDRTLRVYKFVEIKKATRDFGSKRRIKEHEYRGTFNRQVFSVKRRSGDADHEMKMLYKINHFNIVRLHGFCQHKDDLYLVYEYMENGSLQEWLSRRGSHSWSQCISIALDVANGLLYLHNFANPAYVHNDLTSSNILLDRNLRAKIANFSLAREANCNAIEQVMDSKGCMPPECLDAGPVTPKVDVYAFGVVLLELITDKIPVFEILLSTTMAALMESPNAETELCHFVGPGLTENGGMQYAIQVVKLSLSCLKQDPSDRPDMVEVVSILLKMQSVINKAIVKS